MKNNRHNCKLILEHDPLLKDVFRHNILTEQTDIVKLNYRFHNPNTAEVTADYLLKILIEANASKVEQAIQEAADELPNEPKHDGGCPA